MKIIGLKKSHGNMYPWVTHMHTHLGGECGHHCSYCYVDNKRFGRSPRYTGNPHLLECELSVDYGRDKTIFIEHKNDIFGPGINDSWINRIIAHCNEFPDNTYVFQSKNPIRFLDFIWPKNVILGTTIESDLWYPDVMRDAPRPLFRITGMIALRSKLFMVKRFITLEPIMDFNPERLANYILSINPHFINLGADSKGHDLPEPTVDKILKLTNLLADGGIELREKYNLDRLRTK